MILANKIIKLRRQLGWSQEDLAEKVNVSRQSVSKWESAASIPDLNKIILLADIFGVTTDYLVKDEIEESGIIQEDKEPGIIKISLEEAADFVQAKIEESKYVAIGVVLCVYSVIPLFFLLALSEGEEPLLNSDIATGIGLVSLLSAVAIAVSFFLRSTRFGINGPKIEEGDFELSYGVRGIYEEKALNNRNIYTQKLSLFISMMIVSVVPLLLVSMFSSSDTVLLMMLVLMFFIIGGALFFLIPAVYENNVYNQIIGEGEYSRRNRKETRRSEKLGAFYWPLVTAVYIGWSLWTMNWGITWIIWPVAGIAFGAVIGLMGLLSRDD